MFLNLTGEERYPGQSIDEQGDVLQNGSQMNAFRHTLGQALIAKEYGRDFAVVVGFAHEDLPTFDTSLRIFSDRRIPSNALFQADTVADQLNNEIGRQIAESLGSDFSNRDAAEAVLRVFRNEGLYVASFQGWGVVTISRKRLTEQQYQKYIKILDSLNEDGNK